jgi:hypothetical protein
MILDGVRFPVREQAGVLPVRAQAVAGQVSGELDAVYLHASSGGGRARQRDGARASDVQRLPRPAQTDGVLRAPARQRPPSADRLDVESATAVLGPRTGDRSQAGNAAVPASSSATLTSVKASWHRSAGVALVSARALAHRATSCRWPGVRAGMVLAVISAPGSGASVIDTRSYPLPGDLRLCRSRA